MFSQMLLNASVNHMPVSYFANGMAVSGFIALDACVNGLLIPVNVQGRNTLCNVNEVTQRSELALGCAENLFALGGNHWRIKKKLPRIGRW